MESETSLHDHNLNPLGCSEVKLTRYSLQKVSKYDQEIPQSQTEDRPTVP